MNRFPQFRKTCEGNASSITEVVRALPFELQSKETVFAVLIRVGEHYLLVPTHHEDVVELNGELTEAVVVSDGDRILYRGIEFVFELGDGQTHPPLSPTDSELVGETTLLVHHRVNNFLQVINGGGFLLDTGIANEDFELVSRGWSTVKSKQDQLAELLSKVVSLKSQPVLKVENNDLGDLLTSAIRDWIEKADIEEVGIDFEPSDQQVCFGFDRLKLGIAIDGLLDLAAKASFPENRKIQVNVNVSGAFVRIGLGYQGTGISIRPENSQNIRMQANETSGGVEFNFSRALVRAHGGDLVLTRVALDQRRIDVYLPLKPVV